MKVTKIRSDSFDTSSKPSDNIKKNKKLKALIKAESLSKRVNIRPNSAAYEPKH